MRHAARRDESRDRPGRAAAVVTHARVVAPAELDDASIEEWNGFLECAGFQSPFLSAAWARMVCALRESARVAVLQDDERVLGFFPYEMSGAALRAARRIGGHLSDCCGLIGEPQLRLSPAELLAAAGIAYFEFDHLPAAQAAHGLPAGRPQWGLRIRIGDARTYWQAVAEHNRPFAKKVDSGARQLARDIGPLRFAFQTADLDAEVANLIARKRAQYARSGVADGLGEPWARALVARAAASTDRYCGGVMSTLYAGDRWVASSLGLRCGELLHEWLPVYEPALRRYGPGHILRRFIIENSAANAISMLDFGEGRNPHKVKYVVETYEMSKGQWTVPGWRALAARAIRSAAWRLEMLRR
jgi:CelD/BcsL family acetyltransferase involved in cellulose biosynthesis